MDEAAEDLLEERLSALCLRIAHEGLMGKEAQSGDAGSEAGENDPAKIGGIYEAEVGRKALNDVRVQLAALGLMEKGKRRRTSSDGNTCWMLTDFG